MKTIQAAIGKERFIVKSGFYDKMWYSAGIEAWQKETFGVYDRYIRPDSIVIDVGASIGILALYAARKARKVYAIEPDPKNYEELTVNVSLNAHNIAPIECHQAALSDRDGEAALFASRFFGDSSASILPRAGHSGKQVNVVSYCFETFCKKNNIGPENLGLIKIDIEGGEFILIPSMEKFIKRHPVPLHLSFHGPYLVRYYLMILIRFKLVQRIILKLEKKFNYRIITRYLIYPLVRKKAKALFDSLKHYRYCYDEKGNPVCRENILKTLPEQGIVLLFTDQPFDTSQMSDCLTG